MARATTEITDDPLESFRLFVAGEVAAIFNHRFLREARVAARLHHPNVASVTFYGEQDGEHFDAMELAEGERLGTQKCASRATSGCEDLIE